MKTVCVLGSTGSVGVNTLKVIESFPDRFKVSGLAVGSNVSLLEEQAGRFAPKALFVKDRKALGSLKSVGLSTKALFSEEEGMSAFCDCVDADILVVATSGSAALPSVLSALRRGKRVALANKEILVVAGSLVMEVLKANEKAELIPVDSEHSAIFQCLNGERREDVERLLLTGSGGPLREIAQEQFSGLTKEVVVNHPRWKMGLKISVDSATLMNKGLEMIEASWIFDIEIDRIELLIHPEAVVHSMVEFRDGSLMAQLGVTDMRLPIQYALGYPERLATSSMRLDWSKLKQLTFMSPDRAKFPCLDLAYRAAKDAGSAPCVLSAADEVAVRAYLEDQIAFLDIPRVIETVLSKHKRIDQPGLHEIQSTHEWAIEETRRLCQVL